MELTTNNGAASKNGTAKELTAKPAQNAEAKKENGNNAKQQLLPGKAAEKEKAEPVKPEQVKPEEQKNEPPVSEVKPPVAETQPVKAELTLEAKLKAVNDLHRKSVQRLNLLSRMKQLEAFEVALLQEKDELEDNPFQGCKLIIKDDRNREFVTTTPGLIRIVSQFIFESCDKKLAEIESAINFPVA